MNGRDYHLLAAAYAGAGPADFVAVEEAARHVAEILRLQARVAELEEERRGLDPTSHPPPAGAVVLVSAGGHYGPARLVRLPRGKPLWHWVPGSRDAAPVDGDSRWMPIPRMED